MKSCLCIWGLPNTWECPSRRCWTAHHQLGSRRTTMARPVNFEPRTLTRPPAKSFNQERATAELLLGLDRIVMGPLRPLLSRLRKLAGFVKDSNGLELSSPRLLRFNMSGDTHIHVHFPSAPEFEGITRRLE